MKIKDLTTVKVGGFDVSIEDQTEQLQYLQVFASFQGSKMNIGLRTGDAPQMLAQSLLHEIIHAIESVYLEGDELSERQLSALAQGLFQVFRDNSEVMATIVAANGEEDG